MARYDTGGGDSLASPPIDILVLGSSGAAAPDRGSTSFLVGGELAVDSGSLASALPLSEQRRIRTVLLTHRHFDHIKELPLFLDNVHAACDGSRRSPGSPAAGGPVEIGAERRTLSDLFRHVFNGRLWPDVRRFRPPPASFFAVTPGRRFTRIGLGIVPLRLRHTAPSLGYVFRRGGSAAAILGDTGYGEEVFRALARIEGLRFLSIEASYPSRLEDLARIAQHLTPALLERGLAAVRKARPRLRVLATHLKPPWAAEIERELRGLYPEVSIARDGARYRFL